MIGFVVLIYIKKLEQNAKQELTKTLTKITFKKGNIQKLIKTVKVF